MRAYRVAESALGCPDLVLTDGYIGATKHNSTERISGKAFRLGYGSSTDDEQSRASKAVGDQGVVVTGAFPYNP